MPFYVFTIGSGLVVLGFTLRVLQVTSGLTLIKTPEAARKFRNAGIIAIAAGLFLALLSLIGMAGNERNTMITAGGNIVALGISTLIQYKLNPSNEKTLERLAWGITVVGFLLCIIYELVLHFQAAK